MIWTLRTKLARDDTGWSTDIEIDSTSTLDELHFAIQEAVDFDNDHLYAFYIARNERSGGQELMDDENGRVFTTTLEDLFPIENKKSLFYWFDFGDDWKFKIMKARKAPHDPQQGVVYPRVVAEVGTKPEQYPDYGY